MNQPLPAPACPEPRRAHAKPGSVQIRDRSKFGGRWERRNSSPGAVAVRWEPPHSCGGGALQRSEKASPIRMRFSAGHFGASPSSSGPLNLINCYPPTASNRAQSNRVPNAPLLDVKISKDLSQPLRKVFRLEPIPILCFHRLTANFNRTLVSIKLSRFDTVIKRFPILGGHLTASKLTQISILQSHG